MVLQSKDAVAESLDAQITYRMATGQGVLRRPSQTNQVNFIGVQTYP